MKDIKAYFSPHYYPTRRDMLILLVLFGGAFFLFLGHAGLIEPDEGRYSEIPREMLEKGDFVTPTLNYVRYFEKPPLHYWLNALFFKLFGLNEFAARFSGTLAGLLTVLLVYHAGRKLFNRRVGLFSAFILGTSAGFLAQSRINLTDMTLTFCLSAAGPVLLYYCCR
jgi:4-amino-4-deoxy-L-arabinose transferase-like glycosyltransferase